MQLLIPISCGRFPRAVREPPHRKLLWGLTWTRYSRWKDPEQRKFGPVFSDAFHYNHFTGREKGNNYSLPL